MGSSEASTRRRVKLYMLNDERQWDDKGTGHVSALYTEHDNMALVVISETDGSYLLESKIQPDTAYQKQQETLIVWSEGENTDLALSFQEKVGCDDVWEKICAVQGKDPSVEITQEVIDEPDDGTDNDDYASTLIQGIQPLSLPPCELSRLEESVDLISQAVASPPKRERLVALLESTNYLNQLVDLFHKAEDLEDSESLHHLYEIMRQLILINKHSLYENLFADDMLMDVIGMLEYNPSGITKHRDFLKNKATFKEVLPLHNAELVNKIHQTYRVQYIQDCCLPPPCLFDEHTLSQLKAFVSVNKMEIIRALQDDEEFMHRLFARLKSPDTDTSHRRDLSLFVKEFCNISIQTDQKESFLSCLLQHGALHTAEVLIAIDDRDIKSAALEILQAFIEHQPSVVREFVYKETAPQRKDDELLINLMINQLLNDSDPELSDAFLLGYMLRILIDPDTMNNPGVRGEKTEFLSFFYRRCVNTLVRPLFDNTSKDVLAKDDYHTALVLNHVLELLTFCIETHTYHMKNFCINRDLLKRVLVLLQSSHKFLVLAALRLLRRVVHMKDEFYNRYLMKNNLFKPVLTLYVSNEYRYNLLDSAIIELFDYIRSEEIASLITHIVDNFWDLLRGINYVQTFNDLKRVYDLSHRPTRPTLVGTAGQQTSLDVLSLVNATSSRFQREPRNLEMEEEQWFDQEEEDEEDENNDHLLSPQTSLLNGTTNSTGIPNEATPTGSIVTLSTVPFGNHSIPTDLLGMGTNSTAQSALEPLATNTTLNSGLDPCANVLPHSANLSSTPSRNLLTDNLFENRQSPVPDRLRLRQHHMHHSSEDIETLTPKSTFVRQNAPITIHIRTPCSNRDPDHTTASDAKDDQLTLGQSSISEDSHSKDEEQNPDLVISSNEESLSDKSPHHSKRSTSDEDTLTEQYSSPKRSRKSRLSVPKQSVRLISHVADSSTSSESCLINSSHSDPSSPESSEVDADDSSPVGLVDYSDEESEEDDSHPESETVEPMKTTEPADNVTDQSLSGSNEVSSSQTLAEVA